MKRPLNARALPFTVKADEALAKLKEWCGHPLSAKTDISKLPGFELLKVLVPFWFYDVALKSDYVAKVGFKHKSVVFSHSSNQYVDTFRYRWRVYNAEHFSKYTADDPNMQRYCSDRLWPEFAKVLREAPSPGPKSQGATDWVSFDESFLQSCSSHIESVKARPTALWPAVLAYMEQRERARAAEKLRRKFGADEVDIRQIELKVLARSVRAAFLPAFVINYSTPRLPRLRAVVSGRDAGRLAAVRQFSPSKIFLLALSVSSAATLALSSVFALPGFSAALFALAPAAFSAWLVRLVPRRNVFAARAAAEAERRRLLAFEKTKAADFRRRQKATKGKPQFDDEEAFSYYSNLFDEQSARHSSQAARARRDAERRLLALDRKGHYRALGLRPGRAASAADVRLAFRAKAHEWHPDRARGSDAAELERRNTEFKRILRAYQVLRSPGLRRRYDARGRE